MRVWWLVLLAACHGKVAPRGDEPAAKPPAVAAVASAPDAAAPAPDAAPDSYKDLGAALVAIIPADARVIGFGELHGRTDRAQVTSSLAHFTDEGLPAIADRVSDLVIETWIVDPHCGSAATVATAKVETTMRRPAATKSEIGKLADAAKAAGIQPHAMRVGCADYARIAPPGQDIHVEAMLDLTTQELGRIATEAVVHRDRAPVHRPWIALYGGALHNDRFPAAGVETWSYAARVDRATHDHFVEIDIVVPELALADAASKTQPWFALAEHADAAVHVWRRGERSFVVVLPRATP